MARYGTDIAALDDLPDPEVLVSEDENMAYAQGRRLLQVEGGLADVGDEDEHDSLDLRDYLGARLTTAERQDLQRRVDQVLTADERVLSATNSVSFNSGTLSVESDAVGSEGPFSLTLSIDDVTVDLLTGGE